MERYWGLNPKSCACQACVLPESNAPHHHNISPFKVPVVERRMVPLRCLNPQNLQIHHLAWQRDLANVMNLRTLEGGYVPGSSSDQIRRQNIKKK